ncbi:transmembrane transport [Seminavis robusta]|uniref:Transmembrane transport n=1 Tax=Seminavis robusta TaxID=568900 RepID=A0A9N8DE77_9STRA|nr:transmembrane transport [Seminavis robusta]|eukprot:Sro77_g042110.1 transmembrane transport (514) ;mRNA; r:71061-72602
MSKRQNDYETIESNDDSDGQESINPRHDQLKSHPKLWAAIGVIQTLMTAGIIFGWASFLPVLREEGVDFTPQAFSVIFTGGAVGNYISTLFFGLIVDKYGPRATGIVASILYAIGLLFCSLVHNYVCLAVGFALLGFAGPGIQMPTLHLANLFTAGASSNNNDDDDNKESSEESSGGGAIFMSAQAAAFDGGTAIFAILRVLFQATGLSSTTFLRLYLVVPAWVFLTSVFVWPDEILEDERVENSDDDNEPKRQSYVGPGSPYISPNRKRKPPTPTTLINAPLSVVLRHPAFWSLATWVSIHILKLNFVVATINDQLEDRVDPEVAAHLIDVFGAMLPFGFVVLPIVATFLDKSATLALQMANIVGMLYGAVMVFAPGSRWLQTLVVFPAVACSRQLVYSTVFHQVGQLFGFANYGTLLGLCNLLVSTVSTVQTPLVNYAETVGSYTGSNMVLWLATLPLFVLVLWSDPTSSSSSSSPLGARKGERAPLAMDDSEADHVNKKRYSSVLGELSV